LIYPGHHYTLSQGQSAAIDAIALALRLPSLFDVDLLLQLDIVAPFLASAGVFE
jgi:hypothetical protein